MRIPDAFSPPPAHAARFRSDHLDEIHAFVARYDGHHRRAALGPGPLGYSMHALRCGGVDLGWGHTRARQKVRGVPQSAILQLPTTRRHVYAVGSRTLEARPDTAMLLAPGQEYTLYFEPNDDLVVLRVPETTLAEELAGREPDRVVAIRETREAPLTGERRTALAALHRGMVDATKSARSHAAESCARQLEAQLCSWMADELLGSRPSSAAPMLAVQRMRRVEEWIDVHLADPITLGRLCAVAGVGDRCLESGFRAHRGQPPLQFVMDRRLARVRRNLLDAGPGNSVTELAHDAGFVHLGRFAARYRRTYDESPSATLRRSLSRA